MRFYADHRRHRARQVRGDLFAGVWVFAGWWAADTAHDALMWFTGPAVAVQDGGRATVKAGQGLVDLPFGVGEAQGYDVMSAGVEIVNAGAQIESAVPVAAGSVFSLIVGVVALVLWVNWGRARLAWCRDAAATVRLIEAGDTPLLAVRAIATGPLPRLASLPSGAVAAFWRGDALAAEVLAGIECQRLGLSTRPRRRERRTRVHVPLHVPRWLPAPRLDRAA